MKNFILWLTDKLFDEKINTVICWVMLGLALMFIAFQAFRGITNHLLIASL